ncbi:MAG TPA: LysM peptidoglycan-binding domain-containing protein [Salinimicrobium sp.]|nr:LysM peptidoglycan-binding domain-containing protein [Salinimicrobium sp.]
MKNFLAMLLLLLSINLSAQQKKPETKNETESSTFRVDTLKIPEDANPLLDADDVEFANKVPSEVFLKDSVIFILADNPKAAEIDSLWQMELYKSSLNNDFQPLLPEEDYNKVVYKELPTDTLKKRLALLDAKTPFKIEYNPILENIIKSYLKRNKKAMEELMALSTYYFPIFEQRLDKYNIPLEIKYLAVVESALNPRARSRMGATGIWQFMYATGKMHGLEVNSYVDERMDPVPATEAAAQYLSTLYGVFGDWDMVLAAYNSGPGNVSKAIRRSGGSENYWRLRPYLPRETAGYVPAFIATMYIFEFAEEHGFQIPQHDVAFFETDTIHTKRAISFDQISKITGVEKEMLQFLNPEYKLDVIPNIKGKNHALRLPRTKTGIFVNNEQEIYEYTRSQLAAAKNPNSISTEERFSYRVQKGDFLGKIAEKFNIRVSSIKKWNNLRSNKLSIGQSLIIYSEKAIAEAKNAENGTKIDSPKVYTVKKGDSLWSISNKYPGLTIQKIKNLNNMNSNRLKPGMRLKLSDG